MWHYAEGGQSRGPFPDEQMRHLYARGSLRDDTLVWREGMDTWKPLGEVAPELKSGAASSPAAGTVAASTEAAVCAMCAKTIEPGQGFPFEGNTYCPACKPELTARISEGHIAAETMQPGGFWIRFVAYIIDSFIMGAVNFVVQLGITIPFQMTQREEMILAGALLSMVVNMVMAAGYEIWFLGKFGATPGKMALGLRVVRPDGSPISYARATGRYFAKIISGLILLIGYIMAAFDDQKRALHDHMCDTRVVRR